MSSFADLISDDVWSNVETARSAAGLVANHTSAVVKAFSEVRERYLVYMSLQQNALYRDLLYSALQVW